MAKIKKKIKCNNKDLNLYGNLVGDENLLNIFIVWQNLLNKD